MRPFTYRNGALHAEDVALATIAEAVGTPFYCYSSAAIEGSFEAFRNAFAGQNALISYAMKANSNQAVLATLAKLGAGMDVVSEGELRRALAAGAPGERIIFSGVGKTLAEMNLGLTEKIFRQVGEQVRRADLARPRCLRLRPHPSGLKRPRGRHAYRLADHRSSAVR
jgi:diaminopimelate decarboxylase